MLGPGRSCLADAKIEIDTASQEPGAARSVSFMGRGRVHQLPAHKVGAD